MTQPQPHPKPFDPTKIKALLFDIDGTLSDSDDLMVEQIHAPLKAIGIFKYPKQVARNLIHWLEKPGNWVLATLDRLGLDSLLAKAMDWREEVASKDGLSLDDFPAIPGIHHMLTQLRGQYPMAVVSARNANTTSNFLRVNHLEEYFKVVIHSQSYRRTKPFPDPLLKAAEVLGVNVEECLMVGDTATDVLAALSAGAYSVSVLCGFGREKELRKAGTHAVLASTADLTDFLRSSRIDFVSQGEPTKDSQTLP